MTQDAAACSVENTEIYDESNVGTQIIGLVTCSRVARVIVVGLRTSMVYHCRADP
jgi:hypothetical protein